MLLAVESMPSDVSLLALDVEILRVRLAADEFTLTRTVGGDAVSVHFGPEFPGDALALYPSLLRAAGQAGSVDGSFVVVDSNRVLASAHGRGIATAAVAMLVETLRTRTDVGSIVARTAVANPASGRVLEKNGFVVTGRATSDEGDLLRWTYSGSTTSSHQRRISS